MEAELTCLRVLCIPAAFVAVGGYNALIEQYFEKEPSANVTTYDVNNRSCAAPRPDAMHLFRWVLSSVWHVGAGFLRSVVRFPCGCFHNGVLAQSGSFIASQPRLESI